MSADEDLYSPSLSLTTESETLAAVAGDEITFKFVASTTFDKAYLLNSYRFHIYDMYQFLSDNTYTIEFDQPSSYMDKDNPLTGTIKVPVTQKMIDKGHLRVMLTMSGRTYDDQEQADTNPSEVTINFVHKITFDPGRGTCETKTALTNVDGELKSLPEAKFEGTSSYEWYVEDEGAYYPVDENYIFTKDETLYAFYWVKDVTIDIGTPREGMTLAELENVSITAPSVEYGDDKDWCWYYDNYLYWYEVDGSSITYDEFGRVIVENPLPSDTVIEQGKQYGLIIGPVFFCNQCVFYEDELDVTLACGCADSQYKHDAQTAYFQFVIGVFDEFSIKVSDGTASLDGSEVAKAYAGQKISISAAKAPDGKVFDKWVVEAGSVELADANAETTSFVMPSADVAITATYKDDGPKYKVIDGAGQTYVFDHANPLKFRCDGPYALFKEVKIDDKSVDASMIKVSEGSTIVEFLDEYSLKLTVGEHTIQFIYTDGVSDVVKFIIKDPVAPKTGDVATTWVMPVAVALICVGMTSLVIFEKKRRYSK